MFGFFLKFAWERRSRVSNRCVVRIFCWILLNHGDVISHDVIWPEENDIGFNYTKTNIVKHFFVLVYRSTVWSRMRSNWVKITLFRFRWTLRWHNWISWKVVFSLAVLHPWACLKWGLLNASLKCYSFITGVWGTVTAVRPELTTEYTPFWQNL